MRVKYPATTTKLDYIELRGGLDLVTPALSVSSGCVRDSINYEQAVTGGYTRIAGYERFDGRDNPSDAIAGSFSYTGSLVAGDVITGVTSTATAHVVSADGSVCAYTAVSPIAFVDGETINVLGSPVAVVVDVSGAGAGADWLVTQTNLAADYYRSLIGAVPGQGSVLGVFYYNGRVFAFRRNASTAAMDLYASSTGGWVQVPFVNEISFTAGSTVYAEGASLTQGGASATVRRVVLESGTWAGGTAAGRLIIGAVSGGPFVAGAAAGGGVCALSGASSAITMTAVGARVTTDQGNFGARTMVYGADGVNRHWEFDGTYLVPIATPVPGSFPLHICVHSEHLFTSIDSSLFCSGTGLPYSSAALDGAAEILAPSAITGLHRMAGDQTTGVLMVGTDTETRVLYGTSSVNFQLRTYEESADTKAYSIQAIGGYLFAFTNLGVVAISASQNFSNFASDTVTHNILPFVQSRRNLLRDTLINREKSQYRLFFSDKYALYITFAKGSVIGAMPMAFSNDVTCACQGQTPDGAETSFFGSSNGMVYRLDAGTSFDGDPIEYRLAMAWAFQKAPHRRKRYRKATLELQGLDYFEISVGHNLGYANPLVAQESTDAAVTAQLSSSVWDVGAWDVLLWDLINLQPSAIDLSGDAENVSISVYGLDDRFRPHTINSIAVQYTLLGLIR
jgi:hypothetical protein